MARQDIKEGPSPMQDGAEGLQHLGRHRTQDVFIKGSHYYSGPDGAAWDCGHRLPLLLGAVPPEPASPAGSCLVYPHSKGWKGLEDPCGGTEGLPNVSKKNLRP